VKRDAPEISFIRNRNIGLEFVMNVETRSSWSFLNSIPQFYIELALDQRRISSTQPQIKPPTTT
jgi:hypothetical protein